GDLYSFFRGHVSIGLQKPAKRDQIPHDRVRLARGKFFDRVKPSEHGYPHDTTTPSRLQIVNHIADQQRLGWIAPILFEKRINRLSLVIHPDIDLLKKMSNSVPSSLNLKMLGLHCAQHKEPAARRSAIF